MGVTLIVKRIIAEIIFWIVNIVLIIMSFMTDRPLASFVTTIICSTPMNPLLLNRIQRKIDGNKFDFWYLLKLILPFFTIMFVLYICAVFSLKNNAILRGMEDIKAFMSITMYLLFIVVLFFYRKNDKSKKYIVFGVFYILCVALNFCSESMVNMIVSFLNRVSTQNICLESYEMLYFNVLTPIKEAILTNIIFDVVFEKKEKKIFSVDVIDKQSLKKENYEIIVQK